MTPSVIQVGSNEVSHCIRTLEYLKRKHRRMLEGPDDVVVADRKIGGRGRGNGKRGTTLTPAEHDVIFVDAQREGVSLEMLARKYNRSTSVVCKIRNRRHPLYDPVRTGVALAARKEDKP